MKLTNLERQLIHSEIDKTIEAACKSIKGDNNDSLLKVKVLAEAIMLAGKIMKTFADNRIKSLKKTSNGEYLKIGTLKCPCCKTIIDFDVIGYKRVKHELNGVFFYEARCPKDNNYFKVLAPKN